MVADGLSADGRSEAGGHVSSVSPAALQIQLIPLDQHAGSGGDIKLGCAHVSYMRIAARMMPVVCSPSAMAPAKRARCAHSSISAARIPCPCIRPHRQVLGHRILRESIGVSAGPLR
jgi:hypothetical protein